MIRRGHRDRERAAAGAPEARARRAFTLVEVMVTIAIIVVLVALTVSASVALVQRSEVRQAADTLRLLDTALVNWQAEAGRSLTWGRSGGSMGNAAFDMYDEVPHVFTLSEVLFRIGGSSQVKAVLSRIDPDFLVRFGALTEPPVWVSRPDPDDPDPNRDRALPVYENDDLNGRKISRMFAVVDPWGTPIRAVHPGPPADDPRFFGFDPDALTVDDDGTVRLDEVVAPDYKVEQIYGSAEKRRVLFVSAGPDGKFGDHGADPHAQDPAERQLHEQTEDNVLSYPIASDHHDER